MWIHLPLAGNLGPHNSNSNLGLLCEAAPRKQRRELQVMLVKHWTAEVHINLTRESSFNAINRERGLSIKRFFSQVTQAERGRARTQTQDTDLGLHSPGSVSHECLQLLPNVPWVAKSPPVENLCTRWRREVTYLNHLLCVRCFIGLP